MQRVVVDTNVYIDWINQRRHEDVLFERDTAKYLSVVVLMELVAGVSSPQDGRIVDGIAADARKLRRFVSPSVSVFAQAGEVLRRLRVERGYRMSSSNSIVNDVLIALSALSIGATVVTHNERDFLAIQSVRSFKLRVLPAR
jgi:predicted nucleic acid-binding protein